MSLIVKIEMHPSGDPHRAQEVATIEIENVSNLAAVSDYVWRLNTDGLCKSPTQRVGKVYRHRRDDGALELLRKVLEKALE
jgi:hypothetical protein